MQYHVLCAWCCEVCMRARGSPFKQMCLPVCMLLCACHSSLVFSICEFY